MASTVAASQANKDFNSRLAAEDLKCIHVRLVCVLRCLYVAHCAIRRVLSRRILCKTKLEAFRAGDVDPRSSRKSVCLRPLFRHKDAVTNG